MGLAGTNPNPVSQIFASSSNLWTSQPFLAQHWLVCGNSVVLTSSNRVWNLVCSWRTLRWPSTIKVLIRPHSQVCYKRRQFDCPFGWSICWKHLKATLRFLSKCLRTDTAFLIKKYKSFLQCPSTATNSCKYDEIEVRCWLSSWTSEFNAVKLPTS